MIATILYFLLALLLLITVHEFGHFIVARCCGVRVLRFSFGFGPVLTSFRDKLGTEYALSLFPLGGYVKMLDETEEAVAPELRHLAFNNQSLIKRATIVLAGPLFNMLFAFVLLWLVLVIGIQSLAPIVDEVVPTSIAAIAGVLPNEEVIALNDSRVNSWRDFQLAMMPLVGGNDDARLRVRMRKSGETHDLILQLNHWHLDSKRPDLLKSLGIIPFVPKVATRIATVVPDSPAARSGFEVGDKILQLDGQPVDDWMLIVDYVALHSGQTVAVEILRKDKKLTLHAKIGQQVYEGKTIAYLGIRSEKPDWPKDWLRFERQSPIAALGGAMRQTLSMTHATFKLLGRLAMGRLDMHSISGPVGIAQGAGESARHGLSYYLAFLAVVSISLGVLNILPIPMLDGGHLLFYLIEAVIRRPVPERLKQIGAYMGVFVLMGLMVLALSNDISRLMGS